VRKQARFETGNDPRQVFIPVQSSEQTGKYVAQKGEPPKGHGVRPGSTCCPKNVHLSYNRIKV